MNSRTQSTGKMTDFSDLERMGRELKCPICLSLLNSAVSLTCNHVFCNSCIQKSMKSASNCPVCKVPFRRREVHPAPHMDNLVSIYKSMEIASGVNMFVTQAAPSTKLSDEDYQLESNEICIDQERGATNLKGPANRRRLKGKGSKKSSKINLGGPNLNPGKPSFPTKKRVQLTQYPPLETSARLANVESVKGEFIKDGPEKCSYLSKERPVFNERGEPVFSPFFWLREEEDIEKLSQLTNGDHDICTPPKAPSFSDIKDSDDEMPSKMTPNGGAHVALNDADYFDSEMFEWTQRACSPELCSTPLKMQVTSTDDFDGVKEKESGASSEAAATVKVPRSGTTDEIVACKLGVASAEVNFCMSSPRTKASNSGDGIQRPSKRCRKAAEKPQMHAKRTKGEVLGIQFPSLEVTDGIIQEKKIDNKGNLLDLEKEICRRNEEIEFDINAKDPTPENVPILSVETKSPFLGDETAVNDCPTSLDKRGSTGEILKLKETNRGCTMGNDWGQKDQPVRSRAKNPSSAEINMAQYEKADLVSKSATILLPVAHDKDISDSCKKMGKSQGKTKNNPKCDSNVRLTKSKIPTCNTSDDKLVNLTKKCHKKNQGTSDIGLGNDLSGMDVTLPGSGLLRKCEGVVNKIQCAFCRSMEDSETSGVLVHYLNGKPVAADYNAGAKVIHAHRNCTEWAPNVYFEDDTAINLEAELARSRRIKCCCCEVKGAALGCYERSCRKSFHFPCAKLIPQCRWDNDNFVMLCPLHAFSKLPSELSQCQVERKKKCNPKRQTLTHQAQVAVKNAVSNKTCCPWNSCGSSRKLVLCCSGIANAEREMVSEFERLSGVVVLKSWESRVTHIIASTDENGACRRTLKVLMGILEGKWILSIEWIKACMKAKELVDEERYEIGVDIHGIRDGPQLGRLRLLNKQPKLFDGCKFYFVGDFVPSYKGYLHDLVTAAGGTVLHRKPISEDHKALTSGCFTSLIYIIYSVEFPDESDPSSRNVIFNRRRSLAEALASSIGATAASNSWVLNSIAGCKLQPLAD